MGTGIPGEEADMTCVICRHGETHEGTTTVTLERGGLTLVVKSVPAQVCESCGEEYLDEKTTARLLGDAERAAREGVQVEVRAFSTAPEFAA
jgi:YgiT-type zinc finger domain-containing protein